VVSAVAILAAKSILEALLNYSQDILSWWEGMAAVAACFLVTKTITYSYASTYQHLSWSNSLRRRQGSIPLSPKPHHIGSSGGTKGATSLLL
jgi:hypothetical protein